MKEKKVFYSELAYVAALLILPLGIVLMEKADLGISMLAAPTYLIFRKFYSICPLFTFGFSEYFFEFLCLVLLIVLIRKVKLHFFFSFVTAFLYGSVLDIYYRILLAFETPQALWARVILLFLGIFVCAFGVAFFFRTYIAPDVHALFIKEVSKKWNFPFARCKTIYDCICCALAIGMSFTFFGFGVFEGVKIGTVICALLNGKSIAFFCNLLDKRFEFSPRWPSLQKYFD